jgi:hypothetical protein
MDKPDIPVIEVELPPMPSIEALWSLAVKVRDNEQCVVCGSSDEILSRLVGEEITDEDGRVDLDTGITLCTSCNIKYERDGKFKDRALVHRDNLRAMNKMTRLNVEINRDLYLKFQALCRYRKTNLSRMIRSIITNQVEEAESHGSQN